MDVSTPNQLTLESGARKLIVTGVALFGLWWKMSRKTEVDPTMMTLVTDNVLLPVIAPALAFIGTMFWSRFRQMQASLKIDTGAALAGVTPSELGAIADRAQQVKVDPNNTASTIPEAVAIVTEQVAKAQQRIPELTIAEAITATTPIKESL
jgi:hypothetical protein